MTVKPIVTDVATDDVAAACLSRPRGVPALSSGRRVAAVSARRCEPNTSLRVERGGVSDLL
jgi:hypothetical protein